MDAHDRSSPGARWGRGIFADQFRAKRYLPDEIHVDLASVSGKRPPDTSDKFPSLSGGLAKFKFQARDQTLLACIEAQVEGNYNATDYRADGSLSKAIATLSARMAENASNSLDSTWISTSRATKRLSAARMLTTACREVDQRTPALAAASEEMVALVGQIRTTAARQGDHVMWKRRLADMAVGHATLKAGELADHHSCRLGKWYYGDRSVPMRGHPCLRAAREIASASRTWQARRTVV